MIVISVDLWNANTGAIENIGRAVIYNDGTGSHERGNYVVEIARRGSSLEHDMKTRTRRFPKTTRKGAVKDHPRLSAPIWTLVRKALEAVGF